MDLPRFPAIELGGKNAVGMPSLSSPPLRQKPHSPVPACPQQHWETSAIVQWVRHVVTSLDEPFASVPFPTLPRAPPSRHLGPFALRVQAYFGDIAVPFRITTIKQVGIFTLIEGLPLICGKTQHLWSAIKRGMPAYAAFSQAKSTQRNW